MLSKENAARDPFVMALQLFALHILLASIGLLTRGENQAAAIIAPAPAALLTFLLKRPAREWGYYCTAVFAAEMVFDKVAYHSAVVVSAGFAAANIVEAFSAASLLLLVLRGTLNIARADQYIVYIIAAGFVGTGLGAALGAALGGVFGAPAIGAAYSTAVQRWWFGDAITHFTLTPALLLAWKLPKSRWRTTRRQLANGAALALVLMANLAVGPIIAKSYWHAQMPIELALISLPIILWLVSRERLLVLCIANSVGTICSLILLSSFHLSDATPHELIEIQTFLAIVSATILLGGALFEDRLVALQVAEDNIVRQQRSAQANKLQALGLLTGGIAHDINNILGLIDLRLELAKKGIAELSPQMIQISKASEAVQRGAKLVRRLLVFSRSKSLSLERYDLNDVIGKLASLLRKTVGMKITIAFFPARAPLMCAVDGAELEAVVVNLIVNARDALGGGGVIRVSLNQTLIDGAESLDSLGAVVQPGKYARITVSDDGCGMSPETLKKCFDPFFTTKSLNNGTGLGLSTMVGFVHQVGGAIYIASEVHDGTEVQLLLPLSSEAAGLTAASKALGTASEPLRTEPLQKTILIVEDDDDFRDALASLLRHRGFNVEVALSALAAEDKLKECPDIVLVLSDVMMPGGMNGVELLQKVQNKSPHIKCLIMTGYADNELAKLSMAHSPIEIVRKPFDFEDLASRIDKLLTDHEL